MTTFDDREKSFENKFAHDEALVFKVRARRNRLFGEWLAGELGLNGDAVAEYAGSVVAADLEEEGDDDVLRKVVADVEDTGLSMTKADLEEKLNSFMPEAKAQIMEQTES